MDNINEELCSKCGGFCCKKSGCDYFTSDISTINKSTLIELLDSGNVSIVAALTFSKTKEGKKICSPFLYLRARNIDRDIVDLFSMKKQCRMLTPTGCKYTKENRPGGGLNLIPMENNACYPSLNQIDELKKWAPYQNVLSKVAKRYCQMSIEAKLSLDIERTLYEVMTEQFDGISKIEILDVLSCIEDIAECFPEEYKRAREKQKQETCILSLNNKN